MNHPQWLRGLAATMLLFVLTGCGQPQQTDLKGQTMGTYYQIKYVAPAGAPSQKVIQAAIDEQLDQVNQQMSTYRPDSELSRFNQSRVVDTPFPVSPAVIKVVNESIRLNHLTDGALDVTVGPLVNLWGFGPEKRHDQAPSEDDIIQRRAWVGISKLEVRDNALVKHIPELYVDLSSIAKGYGVDVVSEYLESQHIEHYMVDIGGDMRTRGHNGEGVPWRIAIEKPSSTGEVAAQQIFMPGDIAIATSGDYRNYFEENGKRYSHTIDPTTGRPITHKMASITVLHKSAMTADGFATGLDVVGPDRALELADKLGLPIYLIVKTDNGFETRYSKAFKPYLPPTP